jgi:tight adherence protein B
MINQFLPLMVVGAIVMLTMAGFLLLRAIIEWLRPARSSAAENQESVSLLTSDAFSPADKHWSERMDRDFETFVKQTGLGWTSGQALGLIALVSVTLAGILLLTRGEEWLVAMGLLLGVSATIGVLMILRARWRRGVQGQLPDVFYLLARSLRAGESLEQAMETVAEHGTRPLADEFRRGADKIKLGLSIPAALRGMARRVDLPDFNIFVSAVTLHRTVGGNLSLLLDRVAASTRDRNTFRGYVLAATALSRITGFFIAAAPPVLFVAYFYFRPEFIATFLQSANGIRALWFALGLEVVGAIWMYYLLRIDY